MESKQDHSWLLWAIYAFVRWEAEHRNNNRL